MICSKSKFDGFDADGVSVVLQHYLASSPLSARALSDFRDRLPVEPGVDLARMLSDAKYLRRVSEAAEERAHCGDDAPSLLIAPCPISPKQADELLGDRTNLALIFDAESILFQDTVHVLHLDAIESRKNNDGAPGFNILGVHFDWLTTDGRTERRNRPSAP
jgi:hypothetical protein